MLRKFWKALKFQLCLLIYMKLLSYRPQSVTVLPDVKFLCLCFPLRTSIAKVSGCAIWCMISDKNIFWVSFQLTQKHILISVALMPLFLDSGYFAGTGFSFIYAICNLLSIGQFVSRLSPPTNASCYEMFWASSIVSNPLTAVKEPLSVKGAAAVHIYP